jgi:putative PepSY-like beta-lactamase-inhibitor
MKSLKLFMSILAVSLMFFSINANAQNSNTVLPQAIASPFNAKYPNAVIKSCKAESDKYVVKAEIGGNKCFVRFDKNGNWINTMSNIHWTKNLPVAVHNAFNKTKYRAWYVDFITRIDEPDGEFYRIITDDKYLQTDADHAAVFTTYKSVRFKPDGTIADVIDVTDAPLSYAVINR